MRKFGLAATFVIAVACLPSTGRADPASMQSAGALADAGFEARLDAAKLAMMADPERALQLARSAFALLETLPQGAPRRLAEAKGRWLEGEALGRIGKSDEAAAILDGAIAVVVKLAPSGKLHGDLLMSRAATSADLGQVRPALESYQAAFKIFQKLGEERSQAMALQNIGSLYSDAGDHERVLKYYEQSAEIYQGDPSVVLAAHNNIATALKDMGKLDKAEREFRTALAISRKMESQLLEARILTNIASTQLLQGRLQAADDTADLGLTVARSAAAAEWAPFLWGVKAQVADKRGDGVAAERLLQRTFSGLNLEATSPFFRDFHDTAQRIYAQLGNEGLALAHLKALKRIDDETREIRTSTNAALMAAQFDFSNQELKISRLKTGQLERDVLLARSRARLHVILLVSVGVALALALAAYFSIRRSRNRVRAANRDLNQSNLALEKALRAKSEFLATTSHEIRTPLNGILGMTQVLLSDRSVSSETRERVEVVHNAGEMMKTVVDDILDMARIESGRIEILPETISVRKLVRDVARLWVEQAETKGIAIEIDVESAPGSIIEDGRRLKQIVFNLVSNAVKFSDNGTIGIHAEQVAGEGSHALEIRVVDQGIGIPDHQHDAIFEAFHQVDGRTTRKFSGTGLGLAISRSLVEAMGGTIKVRSEPGSGSTFIVRLPLALPASEGDARPEDEPRPVSLARCSALFVEPNPLLQSITGAALDGALGEIVFVEDAAGVKESLAARAFDFVILDADAVASGEMNPRDIRDMCGTVRIVMMQRDEGDGQPAAGLSPDIDAVVAKAFPPVGLASALEAVLRSDDDCSIPEKAAA
ncbi:ATP-binding protein [Sphingosinicella sp. BN140058]|uniref:ATP-binding protein n=1 Tax=Sphingosinicella sp. BN140058 TaxID=1892855 RepID=UPI00101087CF|nr:ATP-binding protein [Sphingosinicella sp. BN140058]QAY78121.1 tetratricopeptide repeat protein [Sphingosinicella sp. BN140058]